MRSRSLHNTTRGVAEACINPHHLTLADPADNQDHKGCARSQAAWCPHRPRCLFTNDRGQWLPCRNTTTRTPVCVCDRDCFGDAEAKANAEAAAEAEV